MVPADVGLDSAWSLMRSTTGAITNSVRNSDSPSSTWFGGVCPAPIAWRRMPSTMTMRVKAVIISRIAGSSVSAVISTSTCSVSV